MLCRHHYTSHGRLFQNLPHLLWMLMAWLVLHGAMAAKHNQNLQQLYTSCVCQCHWIWTICIHYTYLTFVMLFEHVVKVVACQVTIGTSITSRPNTELDVLPRVGFWLELCVAWWAELQHNSKSSKYVYQHSKCHLWISHDLYHCTFACMLAVASMCPLWALLCKQTTQPPILHDSLFVSHTSYASMVICIPVGLLHPNVCDARGPWLGCVLRMLWRNTCNCTVLALPVLLMNDAWLLVPTVDMQFQHRVFHAVH